MIERDLYEYGGKQYHMYFMATSQEELNRMSDKYFTLLQNREPSARLIQTDKNYNAVRSNVEVLVAI